MALTASSDSIILKTSERAFLEGLEGYTPTVDISRLVTEIDTSTKSTDFGWWTPPDYPVERTAGAHRHISLVDYTHSLDDREWSEAVDVKLETWEDDATGTLEMRVRSLGAKAREFELFRFSQILQDGDGGSIYSAYDGGNFYRTDHPLANSSSTWSNINSDNIGTPSAPTVTEMETSLEGSLQLYDQMLDDWGNPFTPMGPVMIMIPQNFSSVMRRVAGATGAWGASMNNPATSSGATGEFENISWVVNPHLNGENDRYYMFRFPTSSVGPFIKVNRTEWETNTWTPRNSQEADEKGAIITTARRRFEYGFGLPQLSVQGVFT